MQYACVWASAVRRHGGVLILKRDEIQTAQGGRIHMNTLIGIIFFIDVLMVTAAIYKIYHSMFNVVYFKLSAYFGEILVMLLIAAAIVAFPGWLIAGKLWGEELMKNSNPIHTIFEEHYVLVLLYLIVFFLIWSGIAVYFSYRKQRR